MSERSSTLKGKELGIVGGALLLLLTWLTHSYSGALEAQGQATREGLRTQRESIQRLSGEITSHVSDTNHFLFQICLNTAKDGEQIARCQENRGR